MQLCFCVNAPIIVNSKIFYDIAGRERVLSTNTCSLLVDKSLKAMNHGHAEWQSAPVSGKNPWAPYAGQARSVYMSAPRIEHCMVPCKRAIPGTPPPNPVPISFGTVVGGWPMQSHGPGQNSGSLPAEYMLAIFWLATWDINRGSFWKRCLSGAAHLCEPSLKKTGK